MSFSNFLARSFEVIEAELPEGYQRIVHSLGGREVSITVDGDHVSVLPDRRRLLFLSQAHAPCVRALTSRDVLTALLSGDSSLLDAVMAQRVQLYGALEDLASFDETLELYFRCAVRCPSFPQLWRAYVDAPASGPDPATAEVPS